MTYFCEQFNPDKILFYSQAQKMLKRTMFVYQYFNHFCFGSILGVSESQVLVSFTSLKLSDVKGLDLDEALR